MLAGGTAMRGVANAVGPAVYDRFGIGVVGLTSAALVGVVLVLLAAAVREPGRA